MKNKSSKKEETKRINKSDKDSSDIEEWKRGDKKRVQKRRRKFFNKKNKPLDDRNNGTAIPMEEEKDVMLPKKRKHRFFKKHKKDKKKEEVRNSPEDLHKELEETKDIVEGVVIKLIDRGEKIEPMLSRSVRLKENAQKFKQVSSKLVANHWWRKTCILPNRCFPCFWICMKPCWERRNDDNNEAKSDD